MLRVTVQQMAASLPGLNSRLLQEDAGVITNGDRLWPLALGVLAGLLIFFGVLWDERRTTVSAAAILADNDTFGAKRKERLDSVSAAVILESFLNWRAHHPDEEPPELVRPEV